MSDYKPYINDNGILVIPFAEPDNNLKYWKEEGHLHKTEGGIAILLTELKASPEVWAKYTHLPYPDKWPEPAPEPDALSEADLEAAAETNE